MECLRSLVSAMMSVIVLSALGAEAESCVNNSVWGPCTSGNLGFRHPLYDTLFAIQVEENGAGIRIDGYLDDWAEHPLDYRYSDIEFATIDGTVVKFEEPFSNGTYGGAADHSHSFMLRWDHSWLYIAVVVYDDIFELTHEINGCYEAGIQLAIEVGGPEARNLDGESVLGLLQAQRSRDVGLSRLVLLNIGPAAQSLFCSCEDCPNVEFSPSQACCVGYENHGVASPLGEGFEYKIKTAIRRDQDSKETIYEVAIHRDDLMYPDWKGRHPSALSRWLSGTTFGFSLSVTEGEEKPGDDPPVQHSWGGYYPHAIVFGWNGGLKEPWKLGSVVLEGVSSSDNDICTGFTIEVTSANDGDATFAIDLLADYLDMPSQSLLESSLAARIVGHPLFGHLLLGRGIEDDHQQEAPIPVSSQWAQQVTPPHDKGASFSSHASQCGTCCFIPGHLSPVKQRSSTCNVACSDCPRSAFMAEGSPGELPEGTKRGAATALDQAWVPGCVNCGLQWLVLEYERPMYVSSIEIHESGRPGAVVKVESTVVFRGDDTVWNTMWDRSPEEADVTAYTNGNVFAPPICSFHNWVKHVRITVSTDNSTELPPAVNAVQASGYLKTPEDYVRVNGGAVKVFYVPFQGMHVSSLANEIFSFQRVMPCNSDQEEASVESVKLPSTRPAASTVGTTWADDLHVPVRPFRRVTVVVPTSLVLNHLSSLLDGSPHGDGLAVIEVRLSQHPSNNKTKIYQTGLPDAEISPAAELAPILPHKTDTTDAAYRFDAWIAEPSGEVRIWVLTNIGVTYRLKMVLGSLCPEEFPIADFNTEECVVQSATDRKTTYIVSSVVGIVALAAAVAAGWLYCRSRRLQNELKDLKLGSQMELIDLDSPVNKVYKFLDDVAKGHKRPKELAKEAGGLRRMLAASGGLLNPNLEEQLLGRYDEQTRLFLMDMIKEEGSKSLGQLASLGRKNTRQKFASDWNLVLRQLGVTSRGFSLLAKVGNEFSLDPFEMEMECNHRPLSAVAIHFIYTSSITQFMAMDLPKLLAWLERIESSYYTQTAPYHCTAHVVDVSMNYAALINRVGLATSSAGAFSSLSDKEAAVYTLAAILAAVIHDLGHDGLSNTYHVNIGDSIARRFNDQAVLENWSLFTALEDLCEGPCGFLADWKADHPAEFRKFRSLLIDLVLATDMRQHFELLSKFKMQAQSLVQPDTALVKAADASQMLLILQILIKCADLGHTTAATDVHIRWCQLLEEELFRQGDLEKQNGLPISPLMDRDLPGVTNPKNCVGFFEVIVLPMFREAVGIFVELKAYLAAAEKNHRMWRNMVASNLTVNDIHHRMDNRDPVLKIQVGPTFGDGYEQGLITALREDR